MYLSYFSFNATLVTHNISMAVYKFLTYFRVTFSGGTVESRPSHTLTMLWGSSWNRSRTWPILLSVSRQGPMRTQHCETRGEINSIHPLSHLGKVQKESGLPHMGWNAVSKPVTPKLGWLKFRITDSPWPRNVHKWILHVEVKMFLSEFPLPPSNVQQEHAWIIRLAINFYCFLLRH